MYKISHLFRIALLSILLADCLVAQTSLPAGTSVHQLDNGLQIILIENSALPMVGVNVVVKTGSAYETFATSGMSHMLEHLLFNGTASRTQKELYDDVDQIGGYNNANTGEYYTNYMMVTPAEHIREGMEIQADMLFNSTLPEEKFEKEKGIVLEEIAQSLTRPASQIERNLKNILYPGHSLSLPTLGTYATIESLPLQNVKEYYIGTYVPNNMVLSAVGNFDTEEMLGSVREIYGEAKPGTVFRPADESLVTGIHPAEEPAEGSIYHRTHGGDELILHLIYKLDDEDRAFFELMDEILAVESPAWEEELREKFPEVVTSINHELHLSPPANFLELRLNLTKTTEISPILESFSQTLASFKIRLGSHAVETFAAKEKTDFFRNLEKPHMFGIYNAHTFAVAGIDGWLNELDFDSYFNAAEELGRFRLSGDPTVVIHHPMDGTDKTENGISIPELFEHEESGLTLIAKQNSVSRLLAVHFLFKHKARLEAEYGKDAAKLFHDCFGQRMDSPEIQRKSSRFGLSFTVNDNPFIPMDNIYLHPDFGYIRVEGLAEDLEGAVEFLSEQINGFVPTEAEFKRAVHASAGGHGMMGQNKARDRFEELYKETVYEENRFTPDTTGLTYEELLAFGEEYFQPANMIVSVVSPFEPEEVSDMFSGFSGVEGDLMEEDLAYDRPFAIDDEPVSIGEEGGGAQSYLFWGFLKKIDEADKPPLKALSLLLSDKIVFDIREKQGMAYRMKAGIDLKGNQALFRISLGTRPQNVNELLPQFPRFFQQSILNDVSDKDLEKSVNMYLGRMMFRRLSSINQAYYLGHSYYFYGDMNEDAKFLEELKSVTLEDVRRVAKKYMDGENPISIYVR